MPDQPTSPVPDGMAPQMPQGEAKPPKHHSHAGMWILGFVLIVLILVLVAVAVWLFQGQADTEMSASELEERVMELEGDLAEKEAEAMEAMEMAESVPPFAYTRFDDLSGFSEGVYMVDPATGDETKVDTGQEFEGGATLWAIPQIGNGNKIFITRGPVDGDLPGVGLYGYDIDTGDLVRRPINVSLNLNTSSSLLSPDQSKVVVLVEDIVEDEATAFNEDQAIVYDLLNDDFQAFTAIEGPGIDFDTTEPQNRFAGLRRQSVRWLDLDCFQISLYNNGYNQETGVFESSFNGNKTFCTE